jgi:hypothetical protein
MAKHWKYLKYVLRHKWYVGLACIRYGVWWAAITHDLSKFHPREWFPYVDKFYGGPWPEHHYGDWRNVLGDKYTQEWVDRRFDVAWNHHQKRNPHHWQYWVLREDDGATKCLEMPDHYRREMLADWYGAGMAINGKADSRSWYLKNRDKILLHPETRRKVEYKLGIHTNH